MSLKDGTKEDLLKKKKQNKIGSRGFGVLFLITLLLYQLEQLSKSTWLVFSIIYILIMAFYAISSIRIDKELKHRDTSSGV